MRSLLQQKIEEIRSKPEEVRRRYALVGVSICMVFVFGIWLLAMEDGFSTVAQEIPTAFGEDSSLNKGWPSLNDLFNQTTPLRIEEKPMEGSEFFRQQLEEKSAPARE